MEANRRSFMKLAAASYAAMTGIFSSAAKAQTVRVRLPKDAEILPAAYKRIATEAAWITQEVLAEYRKLNDSSPADEPGFLSMWGRALEGDGGLLVKRLLDVDQHRLADMEASGIDFQLLLLTSPGVQVFKADKAKALAADSNDQLAEAISKHPGKFDGLAAVAPQDPRAAAKEMERAIQRLKLKGVVINSHTKGHYLDEKKYWDILEAAEALNAPIYIHPRTPSPRMIQPFLERGLDRALLGFGVEVSLHTLGLITSGAFDRFPNLQIVIGHAGEGLPYLLYRIDYWQERTHTPSRPKLKMRPSDYMKRNIHITTSGVPWAPAVTMAQSVLGVDRVMYAQDYPYEYEPYEVAAVDAFPISDEDKKKLFQTNAERVFRLAV